jgi:hypothetical protein
MQSLAARLYWGSQAFAERLMAAVQTVKRKLEVRRNRSTPQGCTGRPVVIPEMEPWRDCCGNKPPAGFRTE